MNCWCQYLAKVWSASAFGIFDNYRPHGVSACPKTPASAGRGDAVAVQKAVHRLAQGRAQRLSI